MSPNSSKGIWGCLWGLLSIDACMTGVEPHLCKVHEMFEACVQMCLLSQRAHMLEVRVVYVGIDAEQTLENAVNDILELGRKRFPIMLGEEVWIVNLGHIAVNQKLKSWPSQAKMLMTSPFAFCGEAMSTGGPSPVSQSNHTAH